jgi:hypothetical protein
MWVLNMADEFNPELARLFAATEETLPAERFVAEVSARLQATRRFHSFRRLGITTAVVAAAVAVSPIVARVSVDLAGYTGAGTERFADLLVSPWGAAASLLVAFFVLRRVRALHR